MSHTTIPFYQVDAFTRTDTDAYSFSGNPAAICPLQQWLPDAVMQQIAAENNLSETAFFVAAGRGYHIRWFTPTIEVDLCGHATLAAAQVLFTELGYADATILFTCRSGALAVARNSSGLLTLDFPVQEVHPVEIEADIEIMLGVEPSACYADNDLMVIVDDAVQVEQLAPDLAALKTLPYRGVIVTAPGVNCDFVCRFFAPASGIDEDPVTGSAYTKLVPYWVKKLGRTQLSARQLSTRGGWLECQLKGNRVLISGRAQLVIRGEFLLPLGR